MCELGQVDDKQKRIIPQELSPTIIVHYVQIAPSKKKKIP
jgi:hypothetical protein